MVSVRPTACYFNPPAPCGAGLSTIPGFITAESISIHPPRAGRDVGVGVAAAERFPFQSTRPVRGGTGTSPGADPGLIPFQSTRPVRGGTIFVTVAPFSLQFQSTRPVRGGTKVKLIRPSDIIFQSTRPVRGGTICSGPPMSSAIFQSTRPVRGGTARSIEH